MPYAILTVILVVLDQIVKYLVLQNIALGEHIPFIPYILDLTDVQNTGAAFSSFPGMRWLFFVIFVLFTVAIIWEFSKKRMPFTTFDRWCIVAIFGGGLGNIIDRVRLGFVVDMIELDFMTFAVFNIADCFISCGCVALLISLLFFNKNFWKDGKK